jgi:hypothetical protein
LRKKMSADARFLTQLAQAKSRLDDWRSLPAIQADTDPDQIANIALSRQRIAVDLGQLYQSMLATPGVRATELSAISRAIAVMRETTLIDLHLINARANLTRVLLDALGQSGNPISPNNTNMPRAMA